MLFILMMYRNSPIVFSKVVLLIDLRGAVNSILAGIKVERYLTYMVLYTKQYQ